MFEVLIYPNEKLRTVAQKVSEFNDDLAQLCNSLTQTMQSHNGVGIAAPQVGLLKRVIIVDHSMLGPIAMINPVIEFASPEKVTGKEGCLSMPSEGFVVQRSTFINVKYNDVAGNEHSAMLSGLDARVVQHEVDHLDGIMMIDRAQKKRTKR